VKVEGQATMVGVIGTGHVGLVTCVSLAEIGHRVIGYDQDPEKISQLRSGSAPFHEPGLRELLARGLASQRLSFTDDVADCVRGAKVVFICVGTPPRAGGEANLVAVERAVRDIARHADGPCVIVEKSTVPTGTAARVKATMQRENPERAAELVVVSNPEFLREGQAIQDAMRPERILIGAESAAGFETMRRLYGPLIANGSQVFEFDVSTAELAKYACNAFLALKISFINALARICEQAQADVVAIAEVMGSDPRIGRAFLDAGIGYGGSCFPKDLQAFDRVARRLGYEFPLLREVARINDEAVEAIARKINDALWNFEGKRIALLGLAFKPGTDDIRFSPALVLASKLVSEGAHVVGYDPIAEHNAKAEMPQLEVASSALDALAGASCAVVCTDWDEIKQLDLSEVRKVMAEAVVVDGRNIFDPDVMQAAGITYYPTGRPPRRVSP